MALVHRWGDSLAYSQGARQATDIETIAALFPGCVSVEKTALAMDKSGVDYTVTLRRGAIVLVDAKTRRIGVSRYWQNGTPELALEIWSIRPTSGANGKIGWTLSELSPVDYILFTFAPADCKRVFLYPFQTLRLAFRRFLPTWKADGYKLDVQTSEDSGRRWQSEALFVPEPVVWVALRSVSVTSIAAD